MNSNPIELLTAIDPALLVAGLALVVSLLVFFLNARQVSLLSRQLRLDSLIKLSDANRAIVVLGIEKPELYKLLSDDAGILNADEAEQRRRYLQLWFNHIFIMWKAYNLRLLDGKEWSACKADIADFLETRSLRVHWGQVREFFPHAFQRFIDKLVPQFSDNSDHAAVKQSHISASQATVLGDSTDRQPSLKRKLTQI